MEDWLASSFKSLTVENDFTDCCISVESRIFRCHKVILGVASDFFKRSFLSGFKESHTGQLVLTNVKADTFEKFRLYVYTYSMKTMGNYSNEDVISLMECANMWMVKSLKTDCDKIIKKRLPKMSLTDLILYFEFAHLSTDEALISDTANNINERCSKGAVLPEVVFELGSGVLRQLLLVLTTIREIQRYNVVEKYVAMHGLHLNLSDAGLGNESDGYANLNPLKVEKLNSSADTDALALSPDPRSKQISSEYVKSLLSIVNFTNMTAKEFAEGPGKSKMITFEEKYKLLNSIVKSVTIPQYCICGRQYDYPKY